MKIQIIFGTESGTTKYVTELMTKMLIEDHHNVDVYEAGRQDTAPVLEGHDLVLLGAPTYAGGQLEDKMATLLSKFSVDLSKYKVGVYSLGDRGFDHFCASAEILEGWVVQNGGKLIAPALKIDGYPTNLDEIQQWIKLVSTK